MRDKSKARNSFTIEIYMSEFLHAINLDIDAPWTSFKVQTNISESTGSNEAFQYASKLLQTCLRDHLHCRDNQHSPLLRRVLDLKELALGPTHNDTSVRLYESKGQSAAYSCLSHCWGGIQPLKIINATLEAHRADIRWADFPKTFQEAIIFTK